MKYLQTISLTSIGAGGGTKEATWAPETAVRIRKIFMTERAAAQTRNIHAYITIGDVPITKPTAPVKVFGEDEETGLVLDRDLPAGTKLYIKLTNQLTAAVDVDVVLVVD